MNNISVIWSTYTVRDIGEQSEPRWAINILAIAMFDSLQQTQTVEASEHPGFVQTAGVSDSSFVLVAEQQLNKSATVEELQVMIGNIDGCFSRAGEFILPPRWKRFSSLDCLQQKFVMKRRFIQSPSEYLLKVSALFQNDLSDIIHHLTSQTIEPWSPGTELLHWSRQTGEGRV